MGDSDVSREDRLTITGTREVRFTPAFRERVHAGRKDYLLGNHPLWELSRSVYQMRRKPYIVGGLLVLGSYVWNWIRGIKRTIPKELMLLRRSDQMRRFKLICQRRFPVWLDPSRQSTSHR